jgi:hypothetical protein
VYAVIIMHRVYKVVGGQLHEAQCGFRQGRGTVDAMFSLRSLAAACMEYRTGMAMAYVDFTKAYDSIHREALWHALALYGVHDKLIRLLQDLHTDNMSRVRLDGQVGTEFKVTSGVRQGCVIAPTLFNVFIDMVVRKALSRMPAGKGISIQKRGPHNTDSIEHVVMLMYADDVVLMAHDVMVLREMLKRLDETATEFGMQINASKTEIQVLNGMPADIPPLVLSTGAVKLTQVFKYLGSWTEEDGGMEKEIGMRKNAALGVFNSFRAMWGNKKLRVVHKMAVYNSFVLPHFMYGCEAWNCSLTQLHSLGSAHRACLRRIMGVDLKARHTTEHVMQVCHSQPIELMIMKRVFKWLGHVMRMPDDRLPKMVYDCMPVGGARPRGRPKGAFRHTYGEFLKMAGYTEPKAWLSEMYERAQDRLGWRSFVDSLSFPPKPPAAPVRRSARIANMLAMG